MRATFLVLLAAAWLSVGAQSRTPEQKITAQGNLILPSQLGNPIFGRLTAPLGELDLSVQFPVYHGLGIGVGGKLMGWELKQNTFTNVNTQGDASRLTYYARVQYAHYTSAITFMEFAAKVGSSQWTWDCVNCTETIRQQSLHWSVNGGYFVHATENLAFGITVGYEHDAARFSPEVICLEDFPGYTDRGGPYDFFTVGLGFSTRFEKSTEERW